MLRKFRKSSPINKMGIIFIFTALAGIALIITANLLIVFNAKEKTFDSTSDIPYNDVALVLGTGKYNRNGNINAYYQFRIDACFRLFKAGRVKYVLISGDNSTKDYDEPTTFRNDLIALGIPEKNIYLDYAGFRTLDSMERALKIFGQKKFTIVSQKFHNERAIYLAESFGIDAVGYNAKDVRKSMGFKTKLREYFARVKVFIDLWTGKESKFLGEPVKIG